MMNFIKNFRKDDHGAVTVDWVVLTAAVVALAGLAYTSIADGVTTLSESIEMDITGTTPSS